MNKNELKLHLKDNPNCIKEVLESVGCHHIKVVVGKRIQSALPNGDNKQSIHIRLNSVLSTTVYTRTEFDKYEIKDFLTLIQYLNESSLNEAINYICKVCNINYSFTCKPKCTSGSYNFLKQYKRSLTRNCQDNQIDQEILDESFLDRFTQGISLKYLNDGISEKTQIKYKISCDSLENRIVIPIRNYNGELISFKGRTMNEDYKKYGIPKFIYYYPIYAENYLFGYYENYFDLISSEEIYIGEAEKFPMQLDSMDIYSGVSVSKKVISEPQVIKLIKLGKPVVLCFDKDVTLNEIFLECRKFKGLIKVSYLYDTEDILKSKESPTDNGREVFLELLEKCKFEYKGE